MSKETDTNVTLQLGEVSASSRSVTKAKWHMGEVDPKIIEPEPSSSFGEKARAFSSFWLIYFEPKIKLELLPSPTHSYNEFWIWNRKKLDLAFQN